MSYKKVTPITWSLTRLLCECGGEYKHKFIIQGSKTPYSHVCEKCSKLASMEEVYPKTTWEEM